MSTFLLSEDARSDLEAISDYIASHNVTAAIKMLDRIKQHAKHSPRTQD